MGRRGQQQRSDNHTTRRVPPQPTVRDPRTATFIEEANYAMEALGFPCSVAKGSGGLAVYASRNISAGERVLVERPLALTVAHELRAQVCAVCLADCRAGPDASMERWPRRCTGCECVAYCSEACEAAGERWHTSVECSALRAVKADDDVDEDIADVVAQAVRILSDRHLGKTVDCGPAGPVGYHSYAQRLVGITPSTAEAVDFLRRSVRAALRALPEEARVPHPEALDLLERHGCNLYGVSGQAGEERACASFVGFFHLLNHACCPNVVFDAATLVAPATAADVPPTFALVALEDVAAGDELCISYTSSAEGPAQRSEHLEEYYGFVCSCRRCTCNDVGLELDFLERLDAKRCGLDECGSGFGVPASVGTHGSAANRGAEPTWLRCVHCGECWPPEDD